MEVYKHKENGYKYTKVDIESPTKGREYFLPVRGQGLDDTPRLLALVNLEDSTGFSPASIDTDLPFQTGTLVKLKTGSSPIRVTNASKYYLSGSYVDTNHKIHGRPTKDFELYQQANKDEEMNNTLYQINLDSKVEYGHYLATNSQGQWVMEVKGTGTILTVDKGFVEEVLPYTISVMFPNCSTSYSYFSEKDKHPVGFYLMDSPHTGFTLVQVTAVDTKSKKATKDFKPFGKIMLDQV